MSENGRLPVSDRPDSGDRTAARAEFVRILNAVLDGKSPPVTHRQLADGVGWTHHTRVYPWLNYKAEPTPEQVFAMEDWLGVEKGTRSRPLGYMPVDTPCPQCGQGADGDLASLVKAFEQGLASLPFLPPEIHKAILTIVAKFMPAAKPLRGRR